MFELLTSNKPKQVTCLEVVDFLYLVNHLKKRTITCEWFSFHLDHDIDFESYIKERSLKELHNDADNYGSLVIFGGDTRSIAVEGDLVPTHVLVMFD